MRQRLLVVGNGMAGMHTVETLLQLAPERYDITVIGREPHGNYNRVLLSPLMAGEKTVEQIQIHDRDWYARQGITLLAGETAEQIDVAARTLRTCQRLLHWDRLILATGSQPRMPQVAGIDLPHVTAFRTLEDVDLLLASGARARCHAGTSSVALTGPATGRHGRGITACPAQRTRYPL